MNDITRGDALSELSVLQGDPEPTVDQMRELLAIAETELRNLSIRLAERIQAVGYEDPCSIELADTILTHGRLVRRLRQQIALETAG